MKCYDCGEDAIGTVGYHVDIHWGPYDQVAYCKKHFFLYCHNSTEARLKEEREPVKTTEKKKGWFG